MEAIFAELQRCPKPQTLPTPENPNADPYFPTDWIEPSEFRFCDKGWHLLPTPVSQPCYCCEGSIAALDREQTLRLARDKIAAARRDGGVPRLRWMIGVPGAPERAGRVG